ncbi:MAG: Cna B-type domain-containing protein, partial [Clostridiales bacterium]|nr:Cna B-type domain-containing protein [Clostridiales bacterium]
GSDRPDHNHCTFDGCTTPQNTNHTHPRTVTGNDTGGTNIEAALRLADNLLAAGQGTGGAIADIDSVYVIMLTDGKPTFYVADGDETGSTLFIKGSVTSGYNDGSTAEFDDYKDVPGRATSIKSRGVTLYSVCYATASDSFTHRWTPSGTGTAVTIPQWLTDIVGVNQNFTAATGIDLSDQLEKSVEIILRLSQAWVVRDAMGANIVFDASNMTANGGAFSANSANVYHYDSDANSIVWDVKNEVTNKETVGNITTYTLTYRVRLNNTTGGFVEGLAYNTNGTANLEYLVLKEGENLSDWTLEQVEDRIQTVPFTSPKVKGYLEDLTFTKVAAYDNDTTVTGAIFTLTSDDGSITRTATSVADGTVTFTGIPSGFDYTLKETGLSDAIKDVYQISDTEYDVGVAYNALTHTLPTGGKVPNDLKQTTKTITIKKVWQTEEDVTGSQITVQLWQDGGSVPYAEYTWGKTDATRVSADGKTWEFDVTVDDNIPSTNGTHIYTVTESTLPGFSTQVEGLVITNTKSGKIDSISVTKQWILPETQTGAPGFAYPTVEIELLKNGAPFSPAKTITLTGHNASGSFDNLDQFDDEGTEIQYSVRENIPAGAVYRPARPVEGTVSTGFTVTNTWTDQTTSIEGTKTWNHPAGTTAPEVTIELYQNGSALNSVTLPADGDDPWTYRFSDLPRYAFTYDGSHITGVTEHQYSVGELDVDGYVSAKSGNNFTNTIDDTTSVTVRKAWVDVAGTAHDSVWVELLQGGNLYAAEGYVNPVQVDENGYTFEDLPKYSPDGQTVYQYTVREESVPNGYSYTRTDGSGTADDPYVIVNTLNDDEDVTVSGSKAWRQDASVTTYPTAAILLWSVEDDTLVPVLDGEGTQLQRQITGGGTS